jgi:hypothetical protein
LINPVIFRGNDVLSFCLVLCVPSLYEAKTDMVYKQHFAENGGKFKQLATFSKQQYVRSRTGVWDRCLGQMSGTETG